MSLKHIVSLLSSFAIAGSAYAAAWTLPEGTSQSITTAAYYRTDEVFSSSGERGDVPAFRKWEINPYYEYGYRDDLTVGFSPFFHYVSQDTASGDTDTNMGLAESELFVRYRAWQGEASALSVQPLVKLPSVYTNDDPKAGRSQMDGELALIGGHHFRWQNQNHFAEGKLAYRHRLGDLGDQVKLEAALGLTMNPQWQLLPKAIYVMDSGDSRGGTSVSGQSDYDLGKLQLTALYRFDDAYAVEFGGFHHIQGENTGAGGGVLASFWVNW